MLKFVKFILYIVYQHNPTIMKKSIFNRMAWVVLLLLFGLNSCQKDDPASENNLQTAYSDIDARGKKSKVDVCHNDHIINISRNAIRAHQRHGDAFDMDGDGYFDIDNSCGPTDCDDSDPSVFPDEEGNCDEPTVADLLVGTWTSTEITINAFVGTQTLVEYLVGVVGLSQADAEAQNDILVNSFIPDLTGSLTLNSDSTYESDFLGGSDTGTWSLSADETILTLIEGPDTIVITINSISETTWSATLSDTFPQDLDSDPGTPDVDVTVVADVILTQ